MSIGVHKSHCCLIRGCKYDESNCPVVTGIVIQEQPCEDCISESIPTVADIVVDECTSDSDILEVVGPLASLDNRTNICCHFNRLHRESFDA